MAFSLSNLGQSEMNQIGASLNSQKDIGNRADIEMQWAMKAMEHAEIHFNLVSSVDASQLRLSQVDDNIYESFRSEFPDFVVAKITEESLKSHDAKKKWREYCETFKGEIDDYNMGTLLRLDCKEDYNQENTIMSVRTQFLAIEIARNKEGHNSEILEKDNKSL